MTQGAATGTRAASRAQMARRHLLYVRNVSVWTMRIAVALAMTAAVALVMLLGQRLQAPDWMRERLEQRIAQGLNGIEIGFGEIQFVLGEDWRPRLRLRDVVLSDAEGQTIVQLADARVSFALAPMLRGQVRPRRIELSGALATLRRDADGNVVLQFGNAVAPAGRARSLPHLIEVWDRRLLTPQLADLVAVEMDSLTLRYEDVRQGRAWTLDGGNVRLTRDGGDLRVSAGFALLSGRDYASSVELNYASVIGETEATIGVSVQDIPSEDIAAQSVALAWLGVLRAPISGALRAGVNADGALGSISATLQIGAGVVQPSEQTIPVPFDAARSYFAYDPAEQVLDFNELSVSSSWGSVVAEGRAYLNGVGDGSLADMIGQFSLSSIRINPPGQYDQPLALDRAGVDFRLALQPFRLTVGQMSIADGDQTIRVSGDLAAAADGWRLAIDAQADRVTSQRLLQLWPRDLSPKPRAWVAANLGGGHLSGADFAMRVRPGAPPDLAGDFDFEDATVRFLRSLPPVTGGAGHASLYRKRFVVTATRGIVTADEGGAVDISGTSFIVPDTSIRNAAPAVVQLEGTGPVTAVISLLNRPPLQVLKGTPLPVDLAEGEVRATATLGLPLKRGARFEEMELQLEGTVDGARSNVLVPGHVTTAPVLQVLADNGQVELSGAVAIDDVPAQVRWHQPLRPGAKRGSRLTGEIELSPRTIATFGIGLPDGSVSGTGRGTFAIDLASGAAPSLDLKSDLRGIGLSLPELGWSKPAPAPGLLELSATLGAQTRIDRLVVQAAGLSATGTVLNRVGGGLDRALLSSVRLGDWLDASVEMVGRGDQAPDIRILDGTLDMRRAEFSSSGGSGGSGPLTVRLGRLQVTDTLALTGFTGEFTTAGGLSGTFGGALNGQAAVTGTIVPKAGRSAVQVRSEDAGGIFRAAGILTNGHGGDFTMTLVPVGEDGQFDGVLKVRDTRVKDAPVIAALLNAVSVVGLVNELAGQGIHFSEVDARFRLGPSRLTVLESSAVGPSIGLSMDGNYDLGRDSMAMRGVISPVYLLNSVGSVLTRKGEGLIGFSYTLSGPAASPSVAVNPLSGLAPGMFRDVFRGAPPEPSWDSTAPARTPQSKTTGTGGDR